MVCLLFPLVYRVQDSVDVFKVKLIKFFSESFSLTSNLNISCILLLIDEVIKLIVVIYAAFLLQRLLTDFETHGEFRCYLNTLQCPGSPAELALLSVDSLEQTADINSLLTLATLAKAPVVLIDELIYTQIEEATKTWATEFQHPLLEDLGAVRPIYAIHSLPAEQADTVSSQAKLILGFNTP